SLANFLLFVGVLHFLEFCIHHILGGLVAAAGLSGAFTALGLFGVELLGRVGGGFRQFGGSRFDDVFVVAFECLFHFLDGTIAASLLLACCIVSRLGQGFAHGVDETVSPVAGVDELFVLVLVRRVVLFISHHLLTLCTGQP